MKGIGIVTLLSVAATAAAPGARPLHPAPLLTAKSTDQFADCFTQVQDRRAAAWWFVPNEQGGTISNLGAPSVSNAYFVVIKDRGKRREVRLQDAAKDSPEAQGVNQCI